MKCPNCGGEHCQFMSSSKTDYKPFVASDACCGFILMGPIGLLCGLCGAESSTTVNEYWICHDCGKKFSSKEAVKNWEAEKNTIQSFRFYLEDSSGVLDSERRQWGKVQAGINEKLENTEFSNALVTRNPAYTDNGLERVKKSFSGVMNEAELTYCIITDGDGAVLTSRGIVVKDHVIPYVEIRGIYLYCNTVYVNQTCIRMSSDNQARAFYGFLKTAVQTEGLEKGKVFYHYEELLHAVQESKAEPFGRETHFSTQKEYEDYLENVVHSYFRKMQEVNPEKYAQYQKIQSEKDRSMKNTRIIRLVGGTIGVLLFSMVGGISGFFLGLVLLGVIPWVILCRYYDGESWNAYKSKYLKPEIRVLMEEQSRSVMERIGNIKPEIYINLIRSMSEERTVDRGGFCVNCGKSLEQKWQSCPYCGSDR